MEGINLEKLEAVVEKMLNNINELKRDKATLEAQVEARNATISDLEEKISSMTFTQEEVSSRVTNLLSSIED
ncbi:MAG: cell division protein ZapB, partial [Desulfobulbaceae bacterium]|nr:cell division protein ZapB [Desulfobulbaceae bacterium]